MYKCKFVADGIPPYTLVVYSSMLQLTTETEKVRVFLVPPPNKNGKIKILLTVRTRAKVVSKLLSRQEGKFKNN